MCINLTVFAGAAFSIEIPILLYSLPNLVSLVDHACSLHPEMPPIKGFVRKAYWLLTKGKPVSEKRQDTPQHWHMEDDGLSLGIRLYVGLNRTYLWLHPGFISTQSFPTRFYKVTSVHA